MKHEDEKDLKTAVTESDNEDIMEMVRVIGAENTVKLIGIFSGCTVYIPTMEALLRSERNKKIYKDFLSGLTFRQLGIKYRLSENTARNIISDMMKKGRKPC